MLLGGMIRVAAALHAASAAAGVQEQRGFQALASVDRAPVLAQSKRRPLSMRAPQARMLSSSDVHLKFAELPITPALKNSIAAMGLTAATPVQQATLQPLLAGT